MNHLDAMDNLREGIGLQSYAQKDPLVEYKNEGYRMFEQLVWGIDDEVAHRIYKIEVHDHPPVPHEHTQIVTNTPESEVSEDLKKDSGKKSEDSSPGSAGNTDAHKKLGRNDPCWCGSGKKWKKCHYPQLG
jgi:preprotein translocase subunit SecA